eukprot:Hpha_TRINITY_DN5880_c0_g1::TRINITY_DN5880_c0_g1_i1::g.45488::m.45488
MYGYLKLRVNLLQWKTVFVFVEDKRKVVWYADYPVGGQRRVFNLSVCTLRLERTPTDFTIVVPGGMDHRFRTSSGHVTGMWFAHIRMLQSGCDPTLLPSATRCVRFLTPDQLSTEDAIAVHRSRTHSPPLTASDPEPKTVLSPSQERQEAAQDAPEAAAPEPEALEREMEEKDMSLVERLAEMGFTGPEVDAAIAQAGGDEAPLQVVLDALLFRRTGTPPPETLPTPESAPEGCCWDEEPPPQPVSPSKRNRKNTPFPGDAFRPPVVAEGDADEAPPALTLQTEGQDAAVPPAFFQEGTAGDEEDVPEFDGPTAAAAAAAPAAPARSPPEAFELAPLDVGQERGAVAPSFFAERDSPPPDAPLTVETGYSATAPPSFFKEGEPSQQEETSPDFSTDAAAAANQALLELHAQKLQARHSDPAVLESPQREELYVHVDPGAAGVVTPGFIHESDSPPPDQPLTVDPGFGGGLPGMFGEGPEEEQEEESPNFEEAAAREEAKRPVSISTDDHGEKNSSGRCAPGGLTPTLDMGSTQGFPSGGVQVGFGCEGREEDGAFDPIEDDGDVCWDQGR